MEGGGIPCGNIFSPGEVNRHGTLHIHGQVITMFQITPPTLADFVDCQTDINDTVYQQRAPFEAVVRNGQSALT